MFDDPFLTQNLFAMFKIVSQLLFLLARQGCPGGCHGRQQEPRARAPVFISAPDLGRSRGTEFTHKPRYAGRGAWSSRPASATHAAPLWSP